jgi:hypothetical protein
VSSGCVDELTPLTSICLFTHLRISFSHLRVSRKEITDQYWQSSQGNSMKVCAMVLCLLIPGCLYAQQYIEASGQTVAFDLKAGARAAWNNQGSGVFHPSITSASRVSPIVCRLTGNVKRDGVDFFDYFAFRLFFIVRSIARNTPEGVMPRKEPISARV